MKAAGPSSGAAKPRQRRYEPKVRSGCRTCRERRVKCGEEKPSCQRCVTAGRVCGGYESMRIAEASTSAEGAMSLKWVKPMSQFPETSTREQEAFHAFRHHVVEQLHGPFNSHIWYRQVLPISMTEPAVRHAVIALGSLRRHYDSEGTQRTDQFALQHYSKALKALQSKIGEEEHAPRDLILIACLLFVAFDLQQKSWDQARSHLDGGLNIIRQLQEEARSTPPPSSKPTMNPLISAFAQLDIQMSYFMSQRVRLNQAIDRARMPKLPAEMNFKHVEDAIAPLDLQVAAQRELVFSIEEQMFSPQGLSAEDRQHYEAELTRQLVSLSHWGQAMSKLFPTISEGSQQQVARILRTQQMCCKLMVYNSLTEGRESVWDSSLPDFERILELANEVVEIDRARNPDGDSTLPCFHLHTGIIAPCYFAIYKCRDPRLRRRALAILSKCKHQEGPWDGTDLLPLAGSIVKLEEQGLDDVEAAVDVPESNRMFRAWYDLRVSDKIIYCKRRRFELDGSWIEYQEDVDRI